MPSEHPLRADGSSTRVHVRAQPGASRAAVVGVHGGELKVRVCSPPVDGRANDEVCAVLAEVVGVKVREVTLVAGHTSRSKVLLVAAPLSTVERALAAWIGPEPQVGR